MTLLRVENLAKSYGRHRALRDVTLSVEAGEVVAVLGDNAAGKSTLVNVLAGVIRPDAGTIEIRGERRRFRSPDESRRAGIHAVFQDLALVESRDVASNIFLGSEPARCGFVRRRQMRSESRTLLDSLGIDLPDVTTSVSRLSGGQRQAVAVARAVGTGAALVVVDEPTAALGIVERDLVLRILGDLRDRGRGVVIVSHDLASLEPLADRYVVLHRGEVAGAFTRGVERSSLVRCITYGKLGH